MKSKSKITGGARLCRALLIASIIGAAAIPQSRDALQAQTLNLNYGFVSKRGNGATNAEVIFPAQPDTIIRLTSYDVTGDGASSILKLQAGTYSATLTNAALSTATNVSLYGNSYIVAGDNVVFQKADNTVFSALVDTTNGVQLTFASQLGTALAAGDKVYRMGITHTNGIGAATVRKDGQAIFAAPLRNPLRLITWSNTTATAINSATAAYGSVPQN